MSKATLTQLRHLVALAETGSFTAASESVGRSQAAFSRSVAMLEAGLDVRLVDRIGHQNELTPVGRSVLEHARHVLAEADKLDEAVNLHKAQELGSLRIGLGPTPDALLSEVLMQRAVSAPTFRLALTTGTIKDLLIALRARKIDAIACELRHVPAAMDLEIDPLGAPRNGFLARTGHPVLNKSDITLDDLLRYPVAGTPVSEEQARLIVKQYGPKAHPDVLLSIISNNIRGLLDIAGTSDALFLGLVAVGARRIREGSLHLAWIDRKGLESEFGIITLAGRTEAPAMGVARALMGGIFRDAEAEDLVAPE